MSASAMLSASAPAAARMAVSCSRAARAAARRSNTMARATPAGLGVTTVGALPQRSLGMGRGSAPAALSSRRSVVVHSAEDDAALARKSTDTIYIDSVDGAKRFSNYFWASVVTMGASGFLITGISSYIQHNLIFFLDATDIKFFPQGLVMSFYGVAGSLLATYLWLTINWNVGAGYNEFNKDEGIMRIFRYGFPGNNRRINLVSDLSDVQAVRVEIKDGVNPSRTVYVRCKGKSDIPLTRIGQPLTLAEVEKQAADLAKFLQVPIEGL